MRNLIVAAIALCVLSACTQTARAPKSTASPVSAIANGRAIFLTGKDAEGFQIMAQRPPLRSSCAACHGRSGAGGVHFPDGVVSADLRHKALVVRQKHPYTLPLLERAISMGIDNEGKPLDPVMPHWKMTPRDLHDVATYVLTLK